MNIPQLEEKYADLIKSIKIKRAIVYAVTITVTLLVIFLTVPFRLELMGEVLTDREGRGSPVLPRPERQSPGLRGAAPDRSR